MSIDVEKIKYGYPVRTTILQLIPKVNEIIDKSGSGGGGSQSDIDKLKEQVSALETNVSTLGVEVVNIKTAITNIENNIDTLESDVSDLIKLIETNKNELFTLIEKES